jgi:hypothetical protein
MTNRQSSCGRGYPWFVLADMKFFYFLSPEGGEGKTNTLGCGFIGSNFRFTKPG